jgi:NADPH:quinone reductase-like Zn-dependent oxidoreductase
MTSTSNKALYVDEDGHILVRNDIKHEETTVDELVIEVRYSGVNPADSKHAQLGIRSTVIGYDFCGTILSAPVGSRFKTGNIVAGYTPSGIGRPLKYGAHQSRLACPDDMVFEVPPNLPESHAAALTVVAMTAADAVFNLFQLALPTAPADYTRPILVWGASSSVGFSAVQFLRASGCKNILVTASPARHELLKRVGATMVFDYATSTVVPDIVAAVEALGEGPISHALDAVGTSSSADLIVRSVKNPSAVLASVTKFDGGFRMPVAYAKDSWRIQPPGVPHEIVTPARPEDHWRAWEALQWAVESYGSHFELPNVEVFQGTTEDALREIVKVGGYGRGFGKLVIQQPLH